MLEQHPAPRICRFVRKTLYLSKSAEIHPLYSNYLFTIIAYHSQNDTAKCLFSVNEPIKGVHQTGTAPLLAEVKYHHHYEKIIFSLSMLAVAFFAACHEDQYKNNDSTQRDFLDIRNPGVTQEDIIRIATKYGLQDSVVQGYKCQSFTLPESGAYPYMDPHLYRLFFIFSSPLHKILA